MSKLQSVASFPTPAGEIPPTNFHEDTEFHRGLGPFDATMLVVGAMIGSGIFLVPADMSRLIGSPGWLLMAWVLTGVLTVAAALSYGELAAMMPRAGGQYVYLREAFSPLWGFLYGWTLFLVIQTGTIAAVAVAFARFAGVLWPAISEDNYLIAPTHVTAGHAFSLSTNQLVAVLLIVILTANNMRGLHYGKVLQNLFTVAKTGALLAMIALGLALGWEADAVRENFGVGNFWSARPSDIVDDGITAATSFGLFAAICVAQTGSLFSADSWHNVTFMAGEVRNPRRNLPLALGLGAAIVIVLYLLANLAYLAVLPISAIQTAPSDRVATAMLARIFPGMAAPLMAGAIMISTFGCNNGLILAGSRAYFAMARDGLFFKQAARLNSASVPAWALAMQGLWAAALVLPRTFREEKYGNLYSDLLDYVISGALLFYVMTISAVFVLRRTRPAAERPYRALGYPFVPALYIAGALVILGMLFAYRSVSTWPGLIIVLLGVPVYFLWRRRSAVASPQQ